jgi:hypothetical protein
MDIADILRYFVTDTSYNTWEETAFSWFSTIFFVAIVFTIVMTLIKLLVKQIALHAKDRVWTRSKVWGFLFLGFLPIFIVLALFWYLSEDFYKVASAGGLIKGTLFSWLIYLIFSLIVNLFPKSWRNEL